MIALADDGDKARSVLAKMSEYVTAQDMSMPGIIELAKVMAPLAAPKAGHCPHCGR